MNFKHALLATAVLALLQPVHAIEFTPFAGYRAGGQINDTSSETTLDINNTAIYGFIISSEPFDMGKTYELYYSHQNTDIQSIDPSSLPFQASSNDSIPLTVDYLHVGGTTPISQKANYNTFMSGGLGLSYLSPDISGLDAELRASFSIGIGMKWLLTDRLSMRLEGRGLATLFNNNSTIFCSGGCTFTVKGNFFTQYELLLGVGYRF